jgi:hypothetical protein
MHPILVKEGQCVLSTHVGGMFNKLALKDYLE